jgi:ubiquinone/menaquinone biosynthesis C-methylase UbiE
MRVEQVRALLTDFKQAEHSQRESTRGHPVGQRRPFERKLLNGSLSSRLASVKQLEVNEHLLDSKQAASAKQFESQSDRYGKSHILANTEDLDMAMKGIAAPAGGTALDVGTGGGHAALWLARHGWKVMAGDIAPRMLKNAALLCAEAGLTIETRLFPAEKMPFEAGSYDLVTARVGPHHFSSPEQFIGEVARVLKPGGHFLLIDGSVPDDDPRTTEWLHHVEKLRDPSHVRFLSPKAWEALVHGAGLTVEHSELQPYKQPDLQWYFETAATPTINREQVMGAVGGAHNHVRAALRIRNERGKIVWWLPRLTLLASKP